MLKRKIKRGPRMGCMAINKKYIVGGGSPNADNRGNNIKIWNRNTCILVRTLEGHSDEVNSVAIDGDRVISGSDDDTIKIWNITTFPALVRTLEGHEARVSSVAIDVDRVISGSWDHTIKIWNINTGECLQTLEANGGVLSVAIDKPRIVSGSDDINIWDINTGESLQTLKAKYLTCVAIKGDFIVYGDTNGTVRRLDITKKRPKILGKYSAQTVGGYGNSSRTYTPTIAAVSIHGNTVLSAAAGGVNLFNLNTGRHLGTLNDELDDSWDKNYNAASIDDYGIVANNRTGFIYMFDLPREVKYPFVQGLGDIEVTATFEEKGDTLEVRISAGQHPLFLKITIDKDGKYKVEKEGGSEMLECIVGKALWKEITQQKYTDIAKMIAAVYKKFEEESWKNCIEKEKLKF